MKVSHSKNNIVYFFLFLFLSVKMVGIHSLLHADDQDLVEHCDVCDYATTQNLIPLISPAVEVISNDAISIVVKRKKCADYSFTKTNIIATGQFLSRPPPFIN